MLLIAYMEYKAWCLKNGHEFKSYKIWLKIDDAETKTPGYWVD